MTFSSLDDAMLGAAYRRVDVLCTSGTAGQLLLSRSSFGPDELLDVTAKVLAPPAFAGVEAAARATYSFNARWYTLATPELMSDLFSTALLIRCRVGGLRIYTDSGVRNDRWHARWLLETMPCQPAMQSNTVNQQEIFSTSAKKFVAVANELITMTCNRYKIAPAESPWDVQDYTGLPAPSAP